MNGAACLDTDNGFTCTCKDGFTGDLCQGLQIMMYACIYLTTILDTSMS